MDLYAARRLMVVNRMMHFHQKHVVEIAKLTNPNVCLHAGSFLRYKDACQHFVVAKLKNLFKEKKLRQASDDAAILRTELANCRTFYRTLLRKRMRSEAPRNQPQPQPTVLQRVQRLRIQQKRTTARQRRDAFFLKAADHQRRSILRRQLLKQ